MRMIHGFTAVPVVCAAVAVLLLAVCSPKETKMDVESTREYNGRYSGDFLNRVAFPIGGIGAGMLCIEGTGAFSHVSVRNTMQFFNEPCSFAAISVKGVENGAKILEGPIPDWKYFGGGGTGNGAAGSSFGLPRFTGTSFMARFPFADIELSDDDIPLKVDITAWSPFIPGDNDNSSLPVGGIEYHFKNPTSSPQEAIFSYNTKNLIETGRNRGRTKSIRNGFVLYEEGTEENPENEGAFAAFVDDPGVVVDHCWFRGGWWDALTLAWRTVREGEVRDNPSGDDPSPGASLYVPFTLAPGEEKTVRLMFAWYVPRTDLKFGDAPDLCPTKACCSSPFHVPWYAGRFGSIEDVAAYWYEKYAVLRESSALFRDSFYDTTLPGEVVEAVAANLTILKSPTVLRQCDGRLWCFEGCSDNRGCCHGSCTHVWNYAQAIPHLFPALERSLRQTEFHESQLDDGQQIFRSNLPIRPIEKGWAASDGQLGGIMKVHRDWRISGDNAWLRGIWPQVKQSLDWCIQEWDPRETGLLEESHHNTYDINYWGPEGHCGSFYLGALRAAMIMGEALGEDVSRYSSLYDKGRKYLVDDLWNGEYFIQDIRWEGLKTDYTALDPAENGPGYQGVVDMLNEQGPKYQYGTGCLSDGILGFWMARMCGIDDDIIEPSYIETNLASIHKYNLRHDLTRHSNPQRPAFAMGNDGGLLLCTWPHGNQLAIPFVYSDEVWTGIEYQVASHLMLTGQVDKGLEIVRVCRDRYDGRRRNPFNEYECGHWYARAMSSYGLIQGLTGVRYDAVDRTLYIDSQVGDSFRCFLSTATGFGTVGLDNGKPFLEVRHGSIDVSKVMVSGREETLM